MRRLDWAFLPRKVLAMSMSFQGKSVLVIEDDALIAMDVAENLESLGFSVHQVGSVKAAIQYLTGAADKPNVSIVDARLGDGDAKAVATLLRSRGLPFIFTTGDPQGVRDWGYDVPVLSKPFATPDLEMAVRSALGIG